MLRLVLLTVMVALAFVFTLAAVVLTLTALIIYKWWRHYHPRVRHLEPPLEVVLVLKDGRDGVL